MALVELTLSPVVGAEPPVFPGNGREGYPRSWQPGRVKDLRTLVDSFNIDGLNAGFTPVESGVSYHLGSTIRVPSSGFVEMSGLSIPSDTVPSPLDFAAVYMTIDDYVSVEGTGFPAEDMHEAYRKWASKCGRSPINSAASPRLRRCGM